VLRLNLSSKPKTILLSTLGIVILGAVSYGGWRYWKKASEPQEQPVGEPGKPYIIGEQPRPPSKPIIKPATDPNWNLYVNEQFGFSFEYPAGWKITEGADRPDAPIGVIRRTIKLKGPLPEGVEIKHSAYDYILIEVSICENPAERSLLEWLEKDTLPCHYKDGKYLGTPIPQTPNLTVAGEPAYQGYYPESSQAYANTETFFSHKDKVFRILYLESDGGKSRGIYNRILESFKFIE